MSEAANASKYSIALLDPALVHANWNQISTLLERIDFKDHNLETLYAALIDPNVRMYLVAVFKPTSPERIRALIGIELLETALGDRWLSISFVTGQDVKGWIGVAEMILLHKAKTEWGCNRAVGNFRKGIARYLPEWEAKHLYLEREL